MSAHDIETLESLFSKRQGVGKIRDPLKIILSVARELNKEDRRTNGRMWVDLSPSKIVVNSDSSVRLEGLETTMRSRPSSAEGVRTSAWEEDLLFRFGKFCYLIITGKDENEGKPFDDDIRELRANDSFLVFSPEIYTFLEKCFAGDEDGFTGGDEMLSHLEEVDYIVERSDREYELRRWMGTGGEARVFLTVDLATGEWVTIKVPRNDGPKSRSLKNDEVITRTNAELSNHPSLFFGERVRKGEQFPEFMVLPYLRDMPHSSLSERIRVAKKMPKSPGLKGLDLEEALPVFIRILQGLQALHDAGFIHRDLKPSNLYAPIGKPRLAGIFDFGVAAKLSERPGKSSPKFYVPGTLNYAAPEFARIPRHIGSVQSDLYSIGVSLYQTIVGKLPFRRFEKSGAEGQSEFRSRWASPNAADHDRPNFNLKVFKDCPKLKRVLAKVLSANPDKRHRCAGDMAVELNVALKSLFEPAPAPTVTPAPTTPTTPTAPTPTEPTETGRSRHSPRTDSQSPRTTSNVGLIAVSSGSAVLLGVLVAYMWFRMDRTEPKSPGGQEGPLRVEEVVPLEPQPLVDEFQILKQSFDDAVILLARLPTDGLQATDEEMVSLRSVYQEVDRVLAQATDDVTKRKLSEVGLDREELARFLHECAAFTSRK